MTPDNDVPNPTGGGSYVRNADGSLTQVEGTRPQAVSDALPSTVPDASVDNGESSGETPPAAPAAGG